MISQPRLTVPLWAWPTVLSLDAPVVALVWQESFVRTLHLSLGITPRLLLGLSVWLVYAADRWLDGFSFQSERPGSPRHAFYALRRWPLLQLWLVILFLAVVLAGAALPWADLVHGLLLLGLTIGYFIGVHLLPRFSQLIPKEIQVSILFGIGVTLFLWGRADFVELALPLLPFMLLCFLNCAFISLWEHPLDCCQGRPDVLTRLPGLEAWLPPATVMTMGISAILALASDPAYYWTLALCSALLLLLHARGQELDLTARRVLADAVLLLPLALLL